MFVEFVGAVELPVKVSTKAKELAVFGQDKGVVVPSAYFLDLQVVSEEERRVFNMDELGVGMTCLSVFVVATSVDFSVFIEEDRMKLACVNLDDSFRKFDFVWETIDIF